MFRETFEGGKLQHLDAGTSITLAQVASVLLLVQEDSDFQVFEKKAKGVDDMSMDGLAFAIAKALSRWEDCNEHSRYAKNYRSHTSIRYAIYLYREIISLISGSLWT